MGENTNFNINEVIAKIIENNIEKVCSKVAAFTKDQLQKTKIDFNVGFKNYLEKSFDKYSKIKTLIYRYSPKYIYDFFEPNDLMFKENSINSANTDDLLDISRYLIIEGTGGIGKSMLMKHLFLSSLENGDKIPVFIELREINNFEGDLVDFIWHSMNVLGFNYVKEHFIYAIESGQFIFLLDGFDEISSNSSQNVFKQIDEMCDRYAENHYIISSRPSPDEFIGFQRFSILKAQPLTKKQAIQLVTNLEYDTDLKSKFLEDLEKSLFDKHGDFASNPLLLNIMLLTYDNYAEIPEKLHIFYAQAFETLYLKHDATKSGYRREMKTDLTLDQFNKAFARFCFQTFLKGQISFTLNELQSTSVEVAKHFDKMIPDEFISDLVDSVCLLRRDGLVYSFTHRSFQEYFVAYFIKELDDSKQQLVCRQLLSMKRSGQLSPESVLKMLYDMAKERFEQNVILPILQELYDPNDTVAEQFHKHLSLFIGGVIFDNNIYHTTKKNTEAQPSKSSKYELFVYVVDNHWSLFGHVVRLSEFIANTPNFISKELIEEVKNIFHQSKSGREAPLDSNSLSDISCDFNIKEIFKYPVLLKIIKESWLGKFVEAVMNLRETLEEAQRSSIKEIDDMLGL